jgi:hypothetical protein
MRLAVLLALAGIASSVEANASCIFPKERRAVEIEVLGCISAEAHARFLNLVPDDSGLSPEEKLETLNWDLARDPGVVVQAQVLAVRWYEDPFPELPRWTSSWRGAAAPTEQFYFLRTSGTCAEVPVGTQLQRIVAPVCCDTGIAGPAGCYFDLQVLEGLPSTLRDGA